MSIRWARGDTSNGANKGCRPSPGRYGKSGEFTTTLMEAVDGVLLFGLTTAFLFAVMQVWWPIWMARRYGLDADGVDHGA